MLFHKILEALKLQNPVWIAFLRVAEQSLSIEAAGIFSAYALT